MFLTALERDATKFKISSTDSLLLILSIMAEPTTTPSAMSETNFASFGVLMPNLRRLVNE